MTDTYKQMILTNILYNTVPFLETAIRAEIDSWDLSDDFYPYKELEIVSRDFYNYGIALYKGKHCLTFDFSALAKVDGEPKHIKNRCIYPCIVANTDVSESKLLERYCDDSDVICGESVKDILWQIACLCPDYYYPSSVEDPMDSKNSIYSRFMRKHH